MKKSRKSSNPFYVLLVVVGVAFVVTSMAFYVVTSHATALHTTTAGGSSTPEHPLMLWMDRHGMTAICVELVLLGIGTFGAIGTDNYWQRRATRSRDK